MKKIGPKKLNPLTLKSEGDAKGDEKKIDLTPGNAEVIALSKEYSKRFPGLLGPKIQEFRDFFLSKIAPVVIGMENGLLDGVEVLSKSLDEEVEAAAIVEKLEKLVYTALELKMVTFVSTSLKLNAEEHRALLTTHLSSSIKSEDLLAAIGSILKDSSPPTPKEITPPKPSRKRRVR